MKSSKSLSGLNQKYRGKPKKYADGGRVRRPAAAPVASPFDADYIERLAAQAVGAGDPVTEVRSSEGRGFAPMPRSFGEAGQRMSAVIRGDVEPTPEEERQINFVRGFTEGPASIRAYHGSPYRFERFDISKIGTGEGAQAYGHGLYFAEAEPVARRYRDDLARLSPEYTIPSKRLKINGRNYYDEINLMFPEMSETPKQLAIGVIDRNKGNIEEAYRQLMERDSPTSKASAQIVGALRNRKIQYEPPFEGHMYEVRLRTTPEQLLSLDAPIASQPRNIREELKSAGILKAYRENLSDFSSPMQTRNRNARGENIMSFLEHTKGGPEGAALTLTNLGIPGVRYLDEASRAAGRGTRNYVMFGDDLIDITRRYAEGGLADLDQKYADGGRVRRPAAAPVASPFDADYIERLAAQAVGAGEPVAELRSAEGRGFAPMPRSFGEAGERMSAVIRGDVEPTPEEERQINFVRGFTEGPAIISPATARAIPMATRLPQDERFLQAVENTPGARISDEGLALELLRYQKPEQAGAQAIREGVFYLPATLPSRSVGTYRGSNQAGYGGSEMVRGETLLRAPLAVPGNTGGVVPERAFRELASDAELKKLLTDVRSTASAPLIGGDYYRNVEDFLSKWGANPYIADELVNNSRYGNRMRYALAENVIGSKAREKGYDSIVGTGARKPRISEVFDLREGAYPVPGRPEFETLVPYFEDYVPRYAEGGLAALDEKYAEGGTVRAPKETTISGQEHELAYITPSEAELLKYFGGSGRMTDYGVRAYDDGGGDGGGGNGDGDGGGGGGGDPGDNAGSMSDPGTQDAAGGNAGQGAGPTGAGSGSTGEQGPGPTGEDTGGGETSVTAPETAPAPNTGAFGQFGASLGFGVVGGLAGLGLGVPGLGTVGTAIGTAVDAARANEQLGMMGLDPNVSTTQAIANAVSFGMLGQSVTDQFGQALGFDALAEAPMSAFSGPPSDPGPTADTSGGSDYIAQPAGTGTLAPALASLNQQYSEQFGSPYRAWNWSQIQRDAAANNMTLDAYVARNMGNLFANAPRAMKEGGAVTKGKSLEDLRRRYAEGGDVRAPAGEVAEYDPEEIDRIARQIHLRFPEDDMPRTTYDEVESPTDLITRARLLMRGQNVGMPRHVGMGDGNDVMSSSTGLMELPLEDDRYGVTQRMLNTSINAMLDPDRNAGIGLGLSALERPGERGFTGYGPQVSASYGPASVYGGYQSITPNFPGAKSQGSYTYGGNLRIPLDEEGAAANIGANIMAGRRGQMGMGSAGTQITGSLERPFLGGKIGLNVSVDPSLRQREFLLGYRRAF